MSSGLTSRPSLSAPVAEQGRQHEVRVVGVNLPTFVERLPPAQGGRRVQGVVGVNLPTFVERRLASTTRFALASAVSSGLTSRPSLSALMPRCVAARHAGGVVGVNLPTFVERCDRRACHRIGRQVSSGLTSRPSLSDDPQHHALSGLGECRRG